jgi:A118 family predicted phage portal protein
MALLENIQSYFRERRLLKLRGDLEMLTKSEFAWNPYRVVLPNTLVQKDLVAKGMLESMVWYSGKIEALREYYTKTINQMATGTETDYRNDFFWRTALENTRKIHSGLPQLISKTMSKLIFGNGIVVQPSVYTESGVLDQATTDLTKEAIDLVVKETDLLHKLSTGAITESWAGHIAYKLSFNLGLSSYPIVEAYDPRYFDVIKMRGVLIGIVFKKYIEVGKGQDQKRYVLKEFYTTNEQGDAVINYSLHQVFADGREAEVPLNTLQETADLAEINPVVFTGLKGILAFEKPNIIESSLFVDSPFGQSDYDVAFSLFDGLDEIISGIVEEIRTNKTMRMIPEDFIPRDQAGNFAKINQYVTNFIKYKSDIDQDAKNRIDTTVIPDKTMEHYEKWRVLVANVCNACGLSPISLGITGLESIASSDKTTREKNKTSLETRAIKVELWKPFLEKMLLKVLELTTYIQAQYPEARPDGFPQLNVRWENTDIAVQFNDYLVNSIEDKIATWGQAKASGVASTETIVNQIWGDELSEEDKQVEINRIKIEQNMPLDDPSVLNLNEDDSYYDQLKAQTESAGMDVTEVNGRVVVTGTSNR